MAYKKQYFTDGQKFQAAHLNHIESGIEAAMRATDEVNDRVTEVTELVSHFHVTDDKLYYDDIVIAKLR